MSDDRFMTFVWVFREGDTLSKAAKEEWATVCEVAGYGPPEYCAIGALCGEHHYAIVGITERRPLTLEEAATEAAEFLRAYDYATCTVKVQNTMRNLARRLEGAIAREEVK